MKLNSKSEKVLKWIARIGAVAVVLFGLPFYLGYGNSLPFINPGNSLVDNLWLTIFPLMFVGLILGWKFEKIGGYLIVVPIVIGLSANLIVYKELIMHMLVPLFIGILYLLVGYSKKASKVQAKA